MPESVNEQLLDRLTRNSFYQERFKGMQANRIVRMIKREIIPDVMKKIKEMQGFGLIPDVQEQLLGDIKGIIGEGMTTIEGRYIKTFNLFATQQATFTDKIIREAMPIKIDLSLPTPEMLNTLVKKSTFKMGALKNKTIPQAFAKLDKAIKRDVVREIRAGVVAGDDIATLSQRVRGTGVFAGKGFKTALRQSETLARTAVSHVANSTREAVYKENDDIIKGVEYVATLDSKTTEICMSLDGKVFDIGEGPRPPMHFNCRSTTIPITKSFEEMGIPLKDVDRVDRRAMNGHVPAKQKYGTWLKKQDKQVQIDALGVKKAKLFREGKITVDKFVNRNYKVLNLKELAKREGFDLAEV